MCSPVFRDAVVFYSKENEIVEILHICFDCGSLKNIEQKEFEVDHKIFDLLEVKFRELGHKVGIGEERWQQ